MERPPSNILPFPDKPGRTERLSARERAAAEDAGALSELYRGLDSAKVVHVRRIVAEEKGSLPFRFAPEAFARAEEAVAGMGEAAAIREVNDATEEMIRLDPVRHLLLVDMLERTAEDSHEAS